MLVRFLFQLLAFCLGAAAAGAPLLLRAQAIAVSEAARPLWGREPLCFWVFWRRSWVGCSLWRWPPQFFGFTPGGIAPGENAAEVLLCCRNALGVVPEIGCTTGLRDP